MYHCALVNCRSKMYCNRKFFGLDWQFFSTIHFWCPQFTCKWFGPNLYYSTELLLIICNFWGGWNWYVQKQTGTWNKSIALPHTIVEHFAIKKHFRYQFFLCPPFSLPYFTVHLFQPVIVYRQFLSLLEEKKDTHIYIDFYCYYSQ